MAVGNNTLNFAKNSLQLITGGVFFITLALLPVIVSYSEQHQTRIVNAAPATTLYFMPKTDPGNPLIAKPGDTVSMDIYMNPGTNLPYVTKLNIKYDPIVFEADKESLKINKKNFPKILEGTTIAEGNINITLSTGSGPSKVIKNITKLGTLDLEVKSSNRGEISEVTFGKETLILSINESDFPGESVLESAIPAHIKVISDLMNKGRQNKGIIDFDVYFDGIGESPENVSKNKFVNNSSPRHPDKKVELTIYNRSFEKITDLAGFVSYDLAQGVFRGIAFIEKPIPDDRYYIKLRVPGYKDRMSDTAQKIISGTENVIETFSMKAGDINFDNSINTLDYNIMKNCMGATRPDSDSRNIYNLHCDLNDDLEVDQTDLEILINGLSESLEEK